MTKRETAWFRVRRWLSERIAAPDAQASRSDLPSITQRRGEFFLVCAILFVLATGVRFLYWQDSNAQILRNEMPLPGMTELYRDQATEMGQRGGILFPSEQVDPSDARMVAHPPGYSILMAAMLKAFRELETSLRLIQVLADAAAAILVLLIAAELLPFAAAVIAGTLVALSPHFAYYSILLVPDSMAALPILLAVYVIVRARKRPRLLSMIAAGALIGLSCWLRSNALLLAPFLAAAVWLLFERARRIRYSLALIASMILVIAPITIRNWVAYHHFIPVSLGAGLTFMQGIADYDKAGRFGLPVTDGQTVEKEAEWFGRPEYARHLWAPDGVERDRDRLARGLAIVRENPGWFLTVMLRRMGFMLRYNDFRRQNILHNTTLAPTISATPGFGHGLAIQDGAAPRWTGLPADLIGDCTILSPRAEASLVDNGDAVQITGDDSEDGSMFASAPIAIEKDTDYLLSASVYLDQGPMAIKVQSATDPRITLAISWVDEPDRKAMRKARKQLAKLNLPAAAALRTKYVIQTPFASGNVPEVRLVISNNGVITRRPIIQVHRAELFAIGPTPHMWTRYPREVVRAIQKNLFKTERLLPIILIGVGLLAASRRGGALVILLVVPCYYLLVQSALHTEYRYILGMHYFLFVIAAVTLYCSATAIKQGTLWGMTRLRGD